jgi:hypothetical protein
MKVLENVKKWANEIAHLAVTLMAMFIALEILFGGSALPFLPATDVIGSVTGIVKSLGDQGVAGLIAVWVLYTIWDKK